MMGASSALLIEKHSELHNVHANCDCHTCRFIWGVHRNDDFWGPLWLDACLVEGVVLRQKGDYPSSFIRALKQELPPSRDVKMLLARKGANYSDGIEHFSSLGMAFVLIRYLVDLPPQDLLKLYHLSQEVWQFLIAVLVKNGSVQLPCATEVL